MDSTTLGVFLGGLAAPYVTAVAKQVFGNVEGTASAYLFFGVSFVIALIAVFVTEGFKLDISSPEALVPQLVNATLAVVALGTVVYNSVKPSVKNLEPKKA